MIYIAREWRKMLAFSFFKKNIQILYLLIALFSNYCLKIVESPEKNIKSTLNYNLLKYSSCFSTPPCIS